MADSRLVFVALRVGDLETSARFYRAGIGVPLVAGSWSEEEHWEYSWREGAYLHFALFPGGTTSGAELAFFVDDLEATHERAVTAGAQPVHDPRNEPRGRTASYRDPDGNFLALTERPGR